MQFLAKYIPVKPVVNPKDYFYTIFADDINGAKKIADAKARKGYRAVTVTQVLGKD